MYSKLLKLLAILKANNLVNSNSIDMRLTLRDRPDIGLQIYVLRVFVAFVVVANKVVL